MTWNGAGAWLIFSQSRQVNFSRTCWITFHYRGITSSVSVMSSPSLRSRSLPEHRQTVGPGSTTRSRGRWSEKGFARRALAGTDLPAAQISSLLQVLPESNELSLVLTTKSPPCLV